MTLGVHSYWRESYVGSRRAHRESHFMITLCIGKDQRNKNAFQQDAYRPLVDRIPACIAGGVPGPGGYLVWGVYLVQGGVPGPEGVPAGGTSKYVLSPLPLWTESQTRVKNITLPQTSYVGGKNSLSFSVIELWRFGGNTTHLPRYLLHHNMNGQVTWQVHFMFVKFMLFIPFN